MKKNYFILQMLVLLALLVPWTAWGQNWENNQLGSIDVYINSDGTINSASIGTVDNGVLTINLNNIQKTNGYHFEQKGIGIQNQPVLSPSNIDDYFTFFVGEHNTNILTIRKWNNDKNIYDQLEEEVKVKISKKKERDGYLLITFKKAAIDISKSLEISYTSGKGEKVYDGKEISDDDLKNAGFTVKAGNTTFSANDYTVAIENGKDVGKYNITVTIMKAGYTGSEKTFEDAFEIKQRPITIIVNPEADLTFTVGEENAPTEFAAKDYLTVETTQETDKGLVGTETPTFTGNLTVTGFDINKIGTYPLSQGEAAITDNTTNGFKASNYQPTWSLNDAKVTVEAIKVNPDEINITFDENAQAGDASVTYDGKEHGVTKVMIGTKTLAESDYKVTYTDNNNKPIPDKQPIHVLVGSEGTPGAYTATITLNKEKYGDNVTVSAKVTIKPATLTISATKGDEIAIIWDKGNMVTAADAYLSVSGFVNNESATIKGVLDINPDDKGNYIIKKGTAEVDYSENKAQKNDYIENWGNLAADKDGITADKGDAPVINEGETITIASEGEEGISLTEENATRTYDGKTYTVTKLGDQDLSKVEATIEIKYNGEDIKEIKNAGTYEISVEYRDAEGNTHKGVFTLTITKATLTVTVLPQPITVTDLSNTFVEDNTKNGLMTDVVVDADESKSTIRIEGAQNNEVIQFVEGSTLSLTTPAGGTWVVGKNASTITAKTSVGELDKTLQLAEPFATNYTLILNPGDLTINYQITDENKDKVVINFEGLAEGNTKTYDGQPIEVASVSVNGVELTEGYTVTFTDEAGNPVENPTDAGTYTATVAFEKGSNYIGSKEAKCTINKASLTLTFEFDPIFEEGEALDYTIDAVGLANDESIDNAIEATFRIADKANDEGKYNVYIENLLIHKTDNFDPENYEIGYAYDNTVIYLSHGEGDTYIPTGGEGIFEESPVGEIEDIVDPSGESSSGSGIRYNKYKLFLANDNYQISEEEKDAYADEELTLHSRHDKYSTWAGGSFTVWYEHGDKVNDGEYRIFISKNRKDWTELKIDTVSDLYQIRNVQSDIYVKIYGLSGYPVANEEISTTDARAYSQANKIVVITPEPTDVQIISMTGAVVATDQVTGQREFANLMEGIYIVRMGDAVVKLQVRN